MDDKNKNLEERIAQLPPDVRQAVLSVEWESKVQAIGAKHRLHIDQIGLLGDLTLMTLLGLVTLVDYPARVAQEVKVSAEDAAAITHEIDGDVFMPIRDSLKKMAPSSKAAVQPATAPSAPAAFAGAPMPVVPVPFSPGATPIASTPSAPAMQKPDLSAADAMLTTTTVTAPSAVPPTPAAAPVAPTTPSTPPKPQAYSADPYREPPL